MPRETMYWYMLLARRLHSVEFEKEKEKEKIFKAQVFRGNIRKIHKVYDHHLWPLCYVVLVFLGHFGQFLRKGPKNDLKTP